MGMLRLFVIVMLWLKLSSFMVICFWLWYIVRMLLNLLLCVLRKMVLLGNGFVVFIFCCCSLVIVGVMRLIL